MWYPGGEKEEKKSRIKNKKCGENALPRSSIAPTAESGTETVDPWNELADDEALSFFPVEGILMGQNFQTTLDIK